MLLKSITIFVLVVLRYDKSDIQPNLGRPLFAGAQAELYNRENAPLSIR